MNGYIAPMPEMQDEERILQERDILRGLSEPEAMDDTRGAIISETPLC